MRNQILLLVLMILLTVTVSFGQTITASIKGTVKDDFGKPVTGATITVKDEEQQIVTTATTDESGSYQVLDLSIGSYKLVIEKDGLKSESITNINLNAASEEVFDLHMQASLEGKAIKKVAATYPDVAKLTQQQGRVIVGVLVNAEGKVDKVLFLAGNNVFKSSALQAAQKWVFEKSNSGFSGRIAFNFKIN
ncbi:MAG: TonB family protein [Blastocatellia bacterium]